jgi:hypothetical protein
MAAIGANPVRHHFLFAIGTLHEMRHADGIVRPAAITSSFAQFAFW